MLIHPPGRRPSHERRPTSLKDRFSASDVLPLLKSLSYCQREIIKLRYGIGYEGPYTQDEIRRIFRCGIGRVRYLEAKALRKIRAALAKPGGSDGVTKTESSPALPGGVDGEDKPPPALPGVGEHDVRDQERS